MNEKNNNNKYKNIKEIKEEYQGELSKDIFQIKLSLENYIDVPINETIFKGIVLNVGINYKQNCYIQSTSKERNKFRCYCKCYLSENNKCNFDFEYDLNPSDYYILRNGCNDNNLISYLESLKELNSSMIIDYEIGEDEIKTIVKETIKRIKKYNDFNEIYNEKRLIETFGEKKIDKNEINPIEMNEETINKILNENIDLEKVKEEEIKKQQEEKIKMKKMEIEQKKIEQNDKINENINIINIINNNINEFEQKIILIDSNKTKLQIIIQELLNEMKNELNDIDIENNEMNIDENKIELIINELNNKINNINYLNNNCSINDINNIHLINIVIQEYRNYLNKMIDKEKNEIEFINKDIEKNKNELEKINENNLILSNSESEHFFVQNISSFINNQNELDMKATRYKNSNTIFIVRDGFKFFVCVLNPINCSYKKNLDDLKHCDHILSICKKNA